MPWSTRELAELAGTTLKTVRHYHALGLLDEPERASNGYKQYGVRHLVRLLQIRRLSDLGLPLAQIATMDRADEDPDRAIRAVDAELAATIERLQRVRAELAVILRDRAPIDVPDGFGAVADGLSDADRAMLLIYSRVFDAEMMSDVRGLVEQPGDSDAAFMALPADADASSIEAVAQAMLPDLLQSRTQFPATAEPEAHAEFDVRTTGTAVAQAIAELYNPAQLAALQRANQLRIAAEAADPDRTPTRPAPREES